MRRSRHGDHGGRNARYLPSTPLPVKGGIRAQSQRGAFARSWWGRRWLEVLDSFRIGARLQRGRRYARSGQVTGIEIHAGRVEADVQGSRRQPYHVTIELQPLAARTWKRAAAALAREAGTRARLLGGEMPAAIEAAFETAGVSLFPARARDLVTACSCPDWSNPCKHIAAVYYLLAEEFDRDPFLIFRLRGLDRTDLMVLLDAAATRGGSKQATVTKRVRRKSAARASRRAEPLPSDPAAFWGNARTVASADEIPAPDALALLPRRLGGFPFWRGERPFLEALDEIYAAASAAAVELLAREESTG